MLAHMDNCRAFNQQCIQPRVCYHHGLGPWNFNKRIQELESALSLDALVPLWLDCHRRYISQAGCTQCWEKEKCAGFRNGQSSIPGLKQFYVIPYPFHTDNYSIGGQEKMSYLKGRPNSVSQRSCSGGRPGGDQSLVRYLLQSVFTKVIPMFNKNFE